MRQQGNSAESRLGLPEYRGHSLAEKIAFSILVMFVIAALAGAFGDGPLSEASVTSEDAQLRVEYQRFSRRHAQQFLDITFPTQPGAKQAQLSINSDYLQKVQITDVFPRPLESSHHERGQLSFATDGSGKPMSVRVHLESQQAGTQEARFTAGTPDKPVEAHFKQIVYP